MPSAPLCRTCDQQPQISRKKRLAHLLSAGIYGSPGPPNEKDPLIPPSPVTSQPSNKEQRGRSRARNRRNNAANAVANAVKQRAKSVMRQPSVKECANCQQRLPLSEIQVPSSTTTNSNIPVTNKPDCIYYDSGGRKVAVRTDAVTRYAANAGRRARSEVRSRKSRTGMSEFSVYQINADLNGNNHYNNNNFAYAELPAEFDNHHR